jgi:hypothetical protein
MCEQPQKVQTLNAPPALYDGAVASGLLCFAPGRGYGSCTWTAFVGGEPPSHKAAVVRGAGDIHT